MMKTTNSSKSGLFLMELILAIFFFSVAAAICVRLFVTSHELSRESVRLNHAVTMAESIAEAFYGCNGDEAQLAILLADLYSEPQTPSDATEASGEASTPDTVTESDEVLSFLNVYDKKKDITARITIAQDGELVSCHIGIYNDSPLSYTSFTDPIYELHVSLYPQEGAYETE